ncbi:MAG: hypothetical protein HOY76_52445 [Streptomyces sp.]|nr:hypothetical protein [Streptomyces sp.]
MVLLLTFPVALMLLAGWVLAEPAWLRWRARRAAAQPVDTAEHLVRDRYTVIADFYDTPPARGGC